MSREDLYLIYIIVLGKLSELITDKKTTATPKDCGIYSLSDGEPYCLLLRFRYLIIAIISQQNRIAGIKPKMRTSMISVVAILSINKFPIVRL